MICLNINSEEDDSTRQTDGSKGASSKHQTETC